MCRRRAAYDLPRHAPARLSRTGSKAADATVMHAVPRILAGVDPDRLTDQPKAMLLQYVSAPKRASGGKDVIEALADQPGDTAANALRELILGHDPADLLYLRHRLLGRLDGVPYPGPDDNDDFKQLPTAFDGQGAELLTALLKARTARVRAAAAIALALDGQPQGMQAVIAALQADGTEEQLEVLARIVDTPACPIEDNACNLIVGPRTNRHAPEVLAREAKVIQYSRQRM